MRTDPCRQCSAVDFYHKGTFAYCRPCHAEAQKRYKARKAAAEQVEVIKPPSLLLSQHDFKSHAGRDRLACKNGHPVNSENVRMSSQRGGKHLFRRCRACERNARRVSYGLPVETAVRLTDLLDER